MKIYTIGFTQKNAEQFFETLHDNGVEIVIDVRINTTSQLAGFTKGDDLKYFLGKIYDINYEYRSDLAPTKELMKDYRDNKISWEEYIPIYERLLEERKTCEKFIEDYKRYKSICLLCSEATPEKCHRRLLAEKIHALFPDETEIAHI
ncbi:MAG TPA: DUF488 domain-containing protein [bacterium]|nr:DUF488 domain-containing protein [bacterium]